MHFDDLLRKLGEFGRFQQLQYALVCGVALTVTLHSFNMVFVGATPKHRCRLIDTPPEWYNLTQEQQLRLSYPITEDGEFDQCRMYNLSDVDWTSGDISQWLTYTNSNRSVVGCTHGWVYDKDVYSSTIVSQWDLVCENAWRKNMASSIFFAGRLAGSLVGQVADRYGRRPVFFVCAMLQVVVGCSAGFSPNLWFFLTLYFFQGMLQMAIQISCYVLGMEVVGPKYRKTVGLSFNIFRAISQMLLAGIALGIREWKWIEITISLICSFYAFYYWLMPESVRWLLTVGQVEEASEIVSKMAKMNKVTIEKNIVQKIACGKRGEPRSSIVDVLKHWATAKLTIIVWSNWMITAIVYYGVSLNTANLAGNPYLNFFVSGCVEIPALLLGIACLDRFGRKKVYVLFLLVAGLSSICSYFIPTDLDWLRTTLVMIGKFGISGAYGIIQVVAAESFPTVIRNLGMSTASAFARLGGMVSPQIVYLQIYQDSLPLMVFGCLGVLVAMLGLLLRETAGRNLPDSIKDMIKPMELIVGAVTKVDILNISTVAGKDIEKGKEPVKEKDIARQDDFDDNYIRYLTHM